ncbi:hypothetical protein K2X05_14655, partial [bacterium]|nr:hypothetical protein [bacterium]
MLKRLVLKNLLLLSLFGVAFTGCGQKEDSIPYKAPQGAEPLPKGLLPKIDVLSKNPTNTSTSSSRAIRQETIGLNVDINYTSKDRKKADISVIVSYSEAPGTCSQAIYKTKDVDTIILDKPEKKIKFEGFGTAQCLEIENGICKYLFLT